MTVGSEASSPGGATRWLVLAGVWFIYMCFGLTASALAPLVAPIIRDLGISHTQMGSVLGAWQLVFIFAALPCGMIVDRLRPRRALLLGALMVAASGFARSVSQDYLALFLAVGLFGLGGPIISTGAPKVVSQWFRGEERGLAMGIYISGPFAGGVTTLTMTNSVLMPALGHDWRMVTALWACLAVISAGVWLAISALPSVRAQEQDGAGETQVPSMQEVGTLLAIRPVRILLVMAVCMFMINHGFNNWLPEILRAGRMDAATAGFYAALPTIVAVFASLTVPRFAKPGRRLMILAALATMSGISTLIMLLDPGPLLVAGLLLQGISRSAMMTIAMLVLIDLPQVGEQRVGTASGLFFSFAEVGGMAGPLSLGLLYDLTHSFSAGLYMLTGFAVTILCCTVLLKPYVTQRGTVRN